MKIDGFGFYFEKQGRSGEEGAIDPSQQYFEGSHAGDAVVRETGQNTLDNPGKHAVGPIRMVFQLATMRTQDIPDIEGLRQHLDAAASQTKGQQGHERLILASEKAKKKEIQVLRISDYNTTGLTGSESLNCPGSPLSRLTRGKGGSADDERGGSFGIGSAVGPMASQLATVIYTSLPEGDKNSVMAGYSRLATHEIGKTSYRAEGHFTHLGTEGDFSYPRPASKIGPFAERTEPGTDIYILGYRMAEDDPELERVRQALIDNFMVAIDRGRLVVEGIAEGNNWRLDEGTLEGFARNKPETYAFYQALKDQNPAETVLPRIGKVQLFVNIDDRLESKLHTVTMRAPLMKIGTFKHNSVSAKYAGVLICEDTEGNKYLRGLEPPQHHEWDGARDPKNGTKVVQSLKKFVREALKERVIEEIGDVVEIEGLAQFLPIETVGNSSSGEPAIPKSQPEEGSKDESSSVTGDPSATEVRLQKPRRKVQVKVHKPAKSDAAGPEKAQKGRNRGGAKTRQGKGGAFEGAGADGVGTSRIEAGGVRFRSWSKVNSQGDSSVIAVAITSARGESGDLELAALGPGGEPEKDFKLGISRVVLHGPDGVKELSFAENVLKNITLPKDEKVRIDIFVPAGERYRLEAV